MDELEFKSQYVKYYAVIYRLAFKCLGNAQDAEDVMQEVYLRLWKNRDSLPEIENMQAYLIGILKNLIVDGSRSGSKLQVCDADGHPPIAADDDVGRKMEVEEEAEMVRKLIRKLPDKERRILEMRTLEDRSYNEIEARTGMNQPYIRKVVSRAREKLKKMFDNQQDRI